MARLPGYFRPAPRSADGKVRLRICLWHPSAWPMIAAAIWDKAPVLYVFPLLALAVVLLTLLRAH